MARLGTNAFPADAHVRAVQAIGNPAMRGPGVVAGKHGWQENAAGSPTSLTEHSSGIVHTAYKREVQAGAVSLHVAWGTK